MDEEWDKTKEVSPGSGGFLNKEEKKALEKRLQTTRDFPQGVTHDVTREELLDVITRIKNKNGAPGEDGIQVSHWEKVFLNSDVFTGAVCSLCTRLLRTGEWPENWGVAQLSPLFKGKGDPTDAANYRPISLLPTLSKICERIIFGRFQNTPEVEEGIKAEQGAFQRKRGALEQVALVLLSVEAEVARQRKRPKTLRRKRQRRMPPGVFIAVADVAKAFDSTEYERVLLNSQYDGAPLRFLKAWLHGRKTRILLNGRISSLFPNKRGVPQGAVGSAHAFSDFMSGIVDECKQHGVTLRISRLRIGSPLFADDVSLLGPDYENIKLAWSKLVAWCARNGLTLHGGKCSVLYVPINKSHRVMRGEYLELNSDKIKWSDEATYLGVQIRTARWRLDSKGESNNEKVSDKVRRAWRPIRRMLKEGGLPLKAALTFYKSAVLSKLLYGSELRINKRTPSSWEKFHKECCRELLGAYKADHGNTVWGELGIPSLDSMICKNTASFVLRALTSPNSIIREAIADALERDDSDMAHTHTHGEGMVERLCDSRSEKDTIGLGKTSQVLLSEIVWKFLED